MKKKLQIQKRVTYILLPVMVIFALGPNLAFAGTTRQKDVYVAGSKSVNSDQLSVIGYQCSAVNKLKSNMALAEAVNSRASGIEHRASGYDQQLTDHPASFARPQHSGPRTTDHGNSASADQASPSTSFVANYTGGVGVKVNQQTGQLTANIYSN